MFENQGLGLKHPLAKAWGFKLFQHHKVSETRGASSNPKRHQQSPREAPQHLEALSQYTPKSPQRSSASSTPCCIKHVGSPFIKLCVCWWEGPRGNSKSTPRCSKNMKTMFMEKSSDKQQKQVHTYGYTWSTNTAFKLESLHNNSIWKYRSVGDDGPCMVNGF